MEIDSCKTENSERLFFLYVVAYFVDRFANRLVNPGNTKSDTHSAPTKQLHKASNCSELKAFCK